MAAGAGPLVGTVLHAYVCTQDTDARFCSPIFDGQRWTQPVSVNRASVKYSLAHHGSLSHLLRETFPDHRVSGLLHRYRVSIWGDEEVLELDNGDGCPTLNATELYTLKW